MDTELRHASRTGDPVAELTALTRMPALRSLPPCRHCGRDLSRVEVACSRHRCIGGYGPGGLPDMCPACNGTGRTEWPWHGDGGRLALLAYAGDEAARAGLPRTTPAQWRECHPANTWRGVDGLSFDAWIRGLDRWPGARLAAGILAGRAVLPTWEQSPAAQLGISPPAWPEWPGRFQLGPRWESRPSGMIVDLRPRRALDAATEHHLCGCTESRDAWSTRNWDLPPWVLHFHMDPLEAIDAAIEATDEPTIRAAICAGLTGWARAGVL